MTSSEAKERLLRGEPLLGWFAPAGRADEAPGVLRWSDENGAQLELLDTDLGWVDGLDRGESFTLHGRLREGGDVSLLSCWVRRYDPLNRELLALDAPGLAVGEHTTPEERWARAVFTTHNLDRWRPDSGLAYSYPNRRARPQHFRMDWQPPPPDEVQVKGATLAFATSFDAPIERESPVWTVNTPQRVTVEPRKPFTVEHARRHYATPLLALTAFAVNRPDTLTKEVYLDGKRRRVEFWWAGRKRGLSPWRAGRDRALFQAADLRDFGLSIRRWWRLYEMVWPALGIFGDHILEGRSYSPNRYLTLYTAVETYSRERHGHRDPRKLRQYADVPSEVTGCTNRALSLIGASRDYLAHRGNPGQLFTAKEVERGVLDSTRRLEALLQACLLAELGFGKRARAELLRTYYSNWRIPQL